MKKTPVPRKYVSREIRVFVSSTFKDMFKEREVLGKQVFPELRRKCRDRDVEFTEVDLRWGVSSEKEVDSAVEICLREIERCHPYFILLLGERYGYVCKPQEVARLHEISPEFQWLKACGECSVTELEIRHAVFEPLGKGFGIEKLAAYMRCYFRDPGYIDTLAPEVRSNYKDPENRERLAALKDRIRSSGLPVAEYENPEALKDRVLKDLWEIIDRKFPEGSRLSPVEKEALEHEAFARSRTRLYISRTDDFRRLDDHAAGNAPPLVILGESGIGKSALLANWALAYREKHPEDLLIFHFIGSSPNSSDYGAMLRRIMAEMKAHYNIGDEIPSDPEALREQFPMWLAKANAGGRTILILDGLNQLADIERARELAWLPEFIPENVRLFVSTISPALKESRGDISVSATETVYSAVEQRKDWQRFTIHPLSESEQEQLIVNFLKRWGKELEAKYANIIIAAPQTANPLYLRVLLEELRLFGKGYGDTLKKEIEYYLEAPSPVELYQKVLARLKEDYTPKSHPDLVRDVFSMLWAARRGLTEKELLEILDIPHIHWSPLFYAAEESLVSRSGLLSFFHDYLRQATAQSYLPNAESKRSAHLRLADYFESQQSPFEGGKGDVSSRIADELPYHLDRAGDIKRLKACIREIPMFMQLYEDGKHYELIGYWLNAGGTEVMEAEYAETVKGIEDAYTLNQMGYFLKIAGCLKLTEDVFRKALGIREKVLGENHPSTATSINNLATLLQDKVDYATAETLLRRALGIQEKVLGENHPDTATSYNNLAFLLYEKKDYRAAEPLYRKALGIQEKVLGENHLDTAASYHNLATLLASKGDYAAAESMFRKALTIFEKVLGEKHPSTATSISSLAVLLYEKGDHAAAEPLYRKALGIREKVLGENHPSTATSIDNLATLLDSKGDYAAAESMFRKALTIFEKVSGENHPNTATSINNLAGLLDTKGNYAEAEPLYRKALAIREKVLGENHPDTASSYNSLAVLLYSKGDYAAAEPLYRKASGIWEKIFGENHPDTAISYNNLARLFEAEGNYDAAKPFYEKALMILEKSPGKEHPNTVIVRGNLERLKKKMAES